MPVAAAHGSWSCNTFMLAPGSQSHTRTEAVTVLSAVTDAVAVAVALQWQFSLPQQIQA